MIKARCVEKRIEMVIAGYKNELVKAVNNARKEDFNVLFCEIEMALDKGYISMKDYNLMYDILTSVNIQ